MSKLKPFLIGLLLASAGVILAAPASTILRNIQPESSGIYEIGSSTPASLWLRIYTVNASTSNLTVSLLNSANCDVKASVNGVFSCGTDAGGGLEYNPFVAAGFIATSTTASSTFLNISMLNATSTNATSTSLYISGDAVLAGGLTLTCTSCITNTNISDTLTASDLVSGSSVVSNAEVDNDLTISGGTIDNTPIGASTANTAVFTLSTTSHATTTNLNISGTLDVDGLTSALTLTGAGGVFAEYTGTSCTNQFPRSLSALGAATCATVANTDLANSTISGVALGSSLAALTATNGTLTFSGSYDGSTARTVGLNLGSANSWTGGQTFTDATSTTFAIVPAASPTLGGAGRFGFDNTSNNFIMASSTEGHFVVGSATTSLYAFAVSSTSPDFVSGGIIEMPSHFLAQVVTAVICDVDAGTSVVINLSDGTNDTNAVTCTTTSTQFALTSNNTFTAYEGIRLEVGTVTGTVDRVSMRFIGYRSTD